MYPDRDVRRNPPFAGFMIILFWRPFSTPSWSLYPWNINWDSIALNLVPALIHAIHYFPHIIHFLSTTALFTPSPQSRGSNKGENPTFICTSTWYRTRSVRGLGLNQSKCWGQPANASYAKVTLSIFLSFLLQKAQKECGNKELTRISNLITLKTSTTVM